MKSSTNEIPFGDCPADSNEQAVEVADVTLGKIRKITEKMLKEANLEIIEEHE